jgi:AcrR family transcriptional regulator
VRKRDQAVTKVNLNKCGQTLGTKGLKTRDSILKATSELLEKSKGLIPAVATIADRAGVSAATFYVYFSDVGDAVYCLLDDMQPDIEPLLSALHQPWANSNAYERTLAFVAAYFEFWSTHVALLRARETFAEAGHLSFKNQRRRTIEKIMTALSKKLPTEQLSGADPHDLAGVLLTALERLAAVVTLGLYPGLRADHEKYVRAVSYVIYASIAGPRARVIAKRA